VFLHGVWERGTARQGLFGGLDVGAFAALVRELSQFFDLVDLESVLDARSTRRRPRMHLTFDDGLDLVRSGAVDVLDESRVPATVFVNTACVTNQHLMWQHRFSAIRRLRGDAVYLESLNRVHADTRSGHSIPAANRQTLATRHWPMRSKDDLAARVWDFSDMPPVDEFLSEHRPYMDWSDIEEWRRRGHAIGFHTHSHPFVSSLRDDEIETEILGPGAELRDRLGLRTIPFAYPFGDRPCAEREARLSRAGIFSCLLGTGGLSFHGQPPDKLERVEVEAGADLEVFARPLLRRVRATFGGHGTDGSSSYGG